MLKKILIVSATKYEVETLLSIFKINVNNETGLFISNKFPLDISVLITGVGMVNTAFLMGKCINDNFDFIINVGVCGAFNRNLKIGEVVNVTNDILSEMGAEDGEDFIKYEDLKLGGTNVFECLIKIENVTLNSLKKVSGITVNTVHGKDESIKKTSQQFNPDVESMEGAAFFRSCTGLSTNHFQIRAISNYVEKRDKSKWNMPLAINNLNETAIKIIYELCN